MSYSIQRHRIEMNAVAVALAGLLLTGLGADTAPQRAAGVGAAPPVSAHDAGRLPVDCNTNGLPDECDLDCGTSGGPCFGLPGCGESADCNTNGVPDECEVPGLASLFADDVLYGAGDLPYSVAVGDLDGDGDLDLAVANELGGNVSVLLNLGDGTFADDVLYGVVDMGAYEFGIGDYDCNQPVDLTDFGSWDDCMTGPDAGPYPAGCEAFDFEYDNDVDLQDFGEFCLVCSP